jgi:hypothetical protein
MTVEPSVLKCRFSVTTEIIEVNPREFWSRG